MTSVFHAERYWRGVGERWAASEAARGENPHSTMDSRGLFLASTPLNGYDRVRSQRRSRS